MGPHHALMTPALPKDRAWGPLSHPVSPALPSTGRGTAQRVAECTDGASFTPRCSKPPGRPGGSCGSPRLRCPLPAWPGSIEHRHKGHCWCPSPPRGAQGGDGCHNKPESVGEPPGTGEIRFDFIHSSPEVGQEGGRGQQVEKRFQWPPRPLQPKPFPAIHTHTPPRHRSK